MNHILVAAPISEKFKQFLIEKGYQLIYIEYKEDIAQIDKHFVFGIITSNLLQLDKTTLAQFKNLIWIGRLGSGMEIIDLDYCAQHAIQCFNSPNGIANAVAEHVIGMLLSLQHHINSAYNEIRVGDWNREANRGMELESSTIGIIGYGHTGSALAQKLSVFTSSILAYDKYKKGFGSSTVREVSLEHIQEEADIISFHVPLNKETEHYYNEEFISKMSKPHILINASRGANASTRSILRGLASGKILGACLDVLEEEKNIKDILSQENNSVQQLLNYNVIITPHIAGYSYNAIEKMSYELMTQISAF